MRRSTLTLGTCRVVLLGFALCLTPSVLFAWPATVLESLARDARRLLPASLARLMAEREKAIVHEMQRFPPELGRALAIDQNAGRLSPTTLGLLDQRAAAVADMFRQGRVSEGVVALGGLVRVPADLSDPALGAAGGYPPGVTSEYYAFVEGNLGKIPVVLSDPPALRLQRTQLPAYWQSMISASRGHSAIIRTEMYREGRVVPHHRIDFRNPVFGVASLAYSRAVTGIAATWLAVWREARGDMTRQPAPRVVEPKRVPDPRFADERP